MRIGFELHQDEFEYDIRGLLMAFFPGAEIVYRPEEKDGFDPEYGEASNNTFPFSRLLTFGLDVTF